MIIGQMVNLVGLGFVTAEVFDGLGRHMYYLQPHQRRRFQIIGWLDWMQTFIAIMFTKISICLFLLRIKNDKSNKIFMYTLIAANVLVTAVMCFLFLGICRPLHAYWDIGVEGRCLSTHQVEAIVAAQGAFSVLSDIILATTPLFFLRNLQINLRTKILLCILMGAGYMYLSLLPSLSALNNKTLLIPLIHRTAGCSIVRTVLSDRVLNPDLTWSILTNAAWRAAELNLGIVCANAPIARPLYLYYKGRLRLFQDTTTTDTSTPASRMRIWRSWSKSRFWHGKHSSDKHTMEGGEGEGVLRATKPSNQPTDTTLTSVEMGLPIQGYLMKTTKGEREWVDLEEARREVDRVKERAEIGRLERGDYAGGKEVGVDRKGKGDSGRKIDGLGNEEDESDGGQERDEGARSWTARERLENAQGFKGVKRGLGG
ncbi:MAG: hypothetical protein Q9170_006836 [Blastenia crenularia]